MARSENDSQIVYRSGSLQNVTKSRQNCLLVDKCRQTTSRCSNGPGNRFHRVRHENLHNFERKLDQKGLLRKNRAFIIHVSVLGIWKVCEHCIFFLFVTRYLMTTDGTGVVAPAV